MSIVRRPAIQFATTPLDSGLRSTLVGQVEHLAEALQPLDVSITEKAINEFRARLEDDGNEATFSEVARELNVISETLRRELSGTAVFVLDRSKVGHYEPKKPPFGDEVASKFPSLSYDIAEAGKCLALERSTAAAFHAIRSLEAGITAMSRCLGMPDPTKGAERNWGSMLGKIDAEIKRRWNSAARMSGDGYTFEGLHGALAGMQNPYRNATMHFDQIYTAEDAKHVFEMVGGILRKIASRMDENGLPLA